MVYPDILTTVDYPGVIEEMGFYQREETLHLQVTLKEAEAARKQVWTISPGDVVPEVRVKSEQEPIIASYGIDQSIFPTSGLRAVLSRNGSYRVVRSSDTSIVLFQLQRKGFVQRAGHDIHPGSRLWPSVQMAGMWR